MKQKIPSPKKKQPFGLAAFSLLCEQLVWALSSAKPMAMAERLRISLYKITGQPLTTPKYEKIGFWGAVGQINQGIFAPTAQFLFLSPHRCNDFKQKIRLHWTAVVSVSHFLQKSPLYLKIFVETFGRKLYIIITVNPPNTLYIVFLLHPIWNKKIPSPKKKQPFGLAAFSLCAIQPVSGRLAYMSGHLPGNELRSGFAVIGWQYRVR